jgi:hypothetical protein
MSTVVEIEDAIERLPPEAQMEVRDWILRRSWPDQDEDIVVPRSYQQKVMAVLDQPFTKM